MNKKYIKITRNNISGGYIEKIENLHSCIDSEFINTIDDNNVGDSLILTIIELTEEEYNNLKEFSGW